jgi:hypothetical protein
MVKIALQESREKPDFVCFASKNILEIGCMYRRIGGRVLKKYAKCF